MTEIIKVPPHSIEIEEVVLGSILIESDSLLQVVDVLKAECFYKDAHQTIFSAILSLFRVAEPIDIITVTKKLRSDGKLESVGGALYITQLTNRVNSASNIESHARLLSEYAMRRSMISMGHKLLSSAYNDTESVFSLIESTEKTVFDIVNSYTTKNYVHISTPYVDVEKNISNRKEKNNSGVPSGLMKLDAITGGWQDSDFVIIAARPAMGKTGMVITCAANAAIEFNYPCAIFSLEMSANQLVSRIISHQTGIGVDRIMKKQLESYELSQISGTRNKILKAPIYIDDSAGLSIVELRAKARRLKLKHGIKAIFVDYLQLMAGERNKNSNREQEISSISRGLKVVAKELNIPVIALSQLSRDVEKRGGAKRPQLSDLRESGSLESDTDVVMFLHRPEYYGVETDEMGNSTKGLAEIIIAKHRNGATENEWFRFVGHCTKFEDIDKGYMPVMARNPSEPNKDEDFPF